MLPNCASKAALVGSVFSCLSRGRDCESAAPFSSFGVGKAPAELKFGGKDWLEVTAGAGAVAACGVSGTCAAKDLRISHPPQTPSNREAAARAKACVLLQELSVVVLSSVTSSYSSWAGRDVSSWFLRWLLLQQSSVPRWVFDQDWDWSSIAAARR